MSDTRTVMVASGQPKCSRLNANIGAKHEDLAFNRHDFYIMATRI